MKRIAGAASLALCVSTLSAQQIVRDRLDTPTAVGTALISGTIVTDESTPQPVRRAQVTLAGQEAGVVKTAQTDVSGRFTFAGVAAGRYTLSASKPGYVRIAFGARRFDRPGTPITLTDGQQMTGVALKMPRGSVISGTIVDENGQPAFGVQVRVLQYRIQAGERTLGPVATAGLLGEATDDRGVYRLFGLPPGEYIVSATPRNTNVGEIRAMTEAEIRAALAALQQPAATNPALSAGGMATTPAGSPASTPQPTRESGTTVGFAPVYYPGTLTAGGAATITLGAGEERNGVDFALQLVRTAKIEGAIVAPAGVPPQSVTLAMVPSGPGALATGIGPMLLNRASVGSDGKFSYNAVPPGQYTITARAARPAGGAGAGPGPGPQGVGPIEFGVRMGGTPGAAIDQVVTQMGGSGAAYWAMADVTVDGSPVSNVVLTLQPGMTLSGQIEFKTAKALPAPELTRIRVTLTPAATPGGGGGISLGLPVAQVDPAGKFTVTGVTPGRYRLNGIAPAPAGSGPGQGWTLKSAMVKGRDVLDFPLEIGPSEEIADAVLTFTDVTQHVSGVLQDPSGRPAPDYTIVVFAADNKYWTPQSRRIRTVRPSTDGRFTVANLPTGEYRIAALTDIAPNEANDPAFLQQLVAASYQFSLSEGERKVQDLRISGGF